MLLRALPSPRLVPYLRAADTDAARALELYRWSHDMAADCLTVLAHMEVALRHRVDTLLSGHSHESSRGISWFLQPGALDEHQRVAVESITERLVKRDLLARDQIIAGTDLGFWVSFLRSQRQDLWDQVLHRAFDKRMVKSRKDMAAALEKARQFRNRVAHHDSLLRVPIHEEISNVIWIIRTVDEDLAAWVADGSSWKDTYSARPETPMDTVVVAARDAWPLYRDTCAAASLGAGFYVCRPGRAFRDVARMAFHADQAIQGEVPAIIGIRDNVLWTRPSAEAVLTDTSSERLDQKIVRFILWSLEEGARHGLAHDTPGPHAALADPDRGAGRYKVFVLSRASSDPRHLTLDKPVAHRGSGRGSGFTQGQRYVSSHRLVTATSPTDLEDHHA